MIFQAILTRYLGPTNRRESRVKATADAGSVTLNWDNALNSETNHARAALALAAKLKWEGAYAGGGMPNNGGYCFVNIDQQGDAKPAFEVAGAMLYLKGLVQE